MWRNNVADISTNKEIARLDLGNLVGVNTGISTNNKLYFWVMIYGQLIKVLFVLGKRLLLELWCACYQFMHSHILSSALI